MAWLIALALFWWIGSGIAKSIDKADAVRVCKESAEEERHRIFRNRLYVVAWPFYQKLERQAIMEWEDHGFNNEPFATRAVFESFQTEIFGEPIEQIAFRYAFQYLLDHGLPVYRPNPRRTSKSLIHERYIPAHSASETNFAELSCEVHKDIFNIPKLDVFYYEYHSENMQSDELLKFVPPVIMPEVGYYRFKGREYRRDRFPHDYDERCRLYRIQHPHNEVPTIETLLRHTSYQRYLRYIPLIRSDDSEIKNNQTTSQFHQRLNDVDGIIRAEDLTTNKPTGCTLRQCPCCLKTHKILRIHTQEAALCYCHITNRYWEDEKE